MQLHTSLLHLTEDEANELVSNSKHGLETWRKLHRRFDPMSDRRVRNMLRSLMNPGRLSLDALQGAMERWEELLVKYERSKDAG